MATRVQMGGQALRLNCGPADAAPVARAGGASACRAWSWFVVAWSWLVRAWQAAGGLETAGICVASARSGFGTRVRLSANTLRQLVRANAGSAGAAGAGAGRSDLTRAADAPGSARGAVPPRRCFVDGDDKVLPRCGEEETSSVLAAVVGGP